MNAFISQYGKSIVVGGTAAMLALSLLLAPLASAHDKQERKNDNDRKDKKTIVLNLKSHVNVVIGQNGNVVVHGATVTAVSSSTITATTAWGAANIVWTVNAKAPIATIAVGDTINFEGKLATTSAAFTVNAKHVKEQK